MTSQYVNPQPMQSVVNDKHGCPRFRANAIVEKMLDFCQSHGLGLNALATMQFTGEDWEQLAQLIGYSLSGFAELSYASDESVSAATQRYESGVDESSARLAALRALLDRVRDGLRDPVAELFGVHPDDLGGKE